MSAFVLNPRFVGFLQMFVGKQKDLRKRPGAKQPWFPAPPWQPCQAFDASNHSGPPCRRPNRCRTAPALPGRTSADLGAMESCGGDMVYGCLW